MNTLDQNFSSNLTQSNETWYNDFAEKLLSENFLLTALEFHAELTESGKELPKLKDFFSNPGNFEQAIAKPEIQLSVNLPRSSSQATLDSLDLTRYSEDGERTTDDKVAVLEFELRKARETINALRANLTEAAESDTCKFKLQEENLKANQLNNSKSIKPHEQRALNFLINEYLLLNGYKLTSITFSDENESQDFEDWDDVGLNCARPLELLYLYREGLKSTGFSHYMETRDFECQVTLYDEIQKTLHINELETQVVDLTEKINEMNIQLFKKLNDLENQEIREIDSQQSLTSDPENFEIIEEVRNHEGSETKSDKSGRDWTNIIERNKKENLDLKSDSQSFLEMTLEMTVSNDDKIKDRSVFENIENEENIFRHVEKTEQNLEENKSVNGLKFKIDNFHDIGFHEFDEVSDHSFNKDSHKGVLDLMIESKRMPENFKIAVFKHCDMIIPSLSSNDTVSDWIQETCLKDITSDHLIETLSDCLPKITPNIILNKREEITPLLVLSICLNKNLSIRDKLLNLLFNLKKKPDADERRVILDALLVIAKLKGSSMVENEILPQCWEQILHKYVERRMLVAESCFLLIPYVSEAIRNSLIISIAQQLMQDREESVRKASVYILTLLIALMSDENKYSQVLDICMQLFNDQSSDVIKYVNQLLFPALAQWSFGLRRIQSDLFNKLLFKIKKEKNLFVLNVIEILLPFLVMTVTNSEFLLQLSCDSHSSPTKRQEFCHLCKGLCDPALFFQGSVSKIMGVFDFYTSQPNFDTSEWPELKWIEQVFILDLIEAGDNFWEDSTVLKALMSILRYLCLGLGKNVTNSKVKPILLEKLLECENSMVSGQDCKYSIIPLYTFGILSAYPKDYEQEMSNTLRRLICALPLCGVSLIPLKVIVEVLSQHQSWQVLVLEAIWEGVVHQRPLVRGGSALLLNSVIPYIPDDLLISKVMPALVTLSSDPETSVRVNIVPGLGLLMSTKEKGIKNKVYLTFQALLQDCVSSENYSLMVQLVKMITRIYEQCELKFKDEVIIPQLFAMTTLALKAKSKELVEVLVDAFSAITYSQTQVSSQRIFSAVLPGLRQLENICSHSTLSYSEHVDSMIKEVERRLSGSKESVGKLPTSSFEVKRTAMAVSTQIAVEDVRNRVTKIFNPRPNTLQNVSGIFRKKS